MAVLSCNGSFSHVFSYIRYHVSQYDQLKKQPKTTIDTNSDTIRRIACYSRTPTVK